MTLKKRVIVYCLAGIVLLAVLYTLYSRLSDRILPPGSSVSEQQLIHDLKVVVKDRVSVNRISVINNNKLTEEAIPEEDGTIDESYKVLYITSTTRDNKKLNHVYAAMEMFLYMSERKMPFKVKGIQFNTMRNFTMDALWKITVTQEEFTELYVAARKNNLSGEELIREMGESWIAKHNYKGWLK